MGGCLARKGNEQEKAKASEIDEDLRKYRKEYDREIKLLLLGAGDSGKSTIFKQMKVIHMEGYTLEERKAYKLAVIGNLVTTVQCLIRASQTLGILVEETHQKAAENILHLSGLSDLTHEVRHDLIQISKHLFLLNTLQQADLYLPDSAPYFMKHMERVMSDDFIPTVDDILRTRVKTLGTAEINFQVEGNNFKLVDVGGQRSERRKWIHCFSEVTGIIFCVSLSEYNLVLEEDRTVNRMHESIQLFLEICNTDFFQKVALILFLNKSDLFKEKITKVNLDVCFPDYKGPQEYNEALKFIEKKFLQLDKTGRKKIYPHVTIATSTDNMQFVFEAVKDMIIHSAIAGFTSHTMSV